MNCIKCGAQNRDNAKFCSKCGYTVKKEGPSGNIIGGRYKIEKLIKTGGMGSIYRAKHVKLDETCAIKEMIFNSTDTALNRYAMKRFYEEAKILSRLRHKNLPVVTDYFDENNKYYIVMDYIEGEDLEAILNRHGSPGLPEKEVLKWAEEILTVLDYLHSQTPPVIYRDMKPSNIMIKLPEKKLVLVDFGIAKTVQGNIYSGQTAIGTHGYAPVEQYRGTVEPRSDLYALGATLHYLLTGVEPVSCYQEPVRKLNPSVSEELENIIKKAHEEKIENRFSSAAEMLEAVMKLKKEGSLTISTTQYRQKNLPSERIKISYNIRDKKCYRTLLNDSKEIEKIKNIIDRWASQESWFAKNFGKKIDIISITVENALILSIEVLYMERLLEEGLEPCSNETGKNLTYKKPSYKSLEDYPIISPPESFTTKLEDNYIFQNSRQICKCSKCSGTGDNICKYCRGKGINTKTRQIKDKSSSLTDKCHYCSGTGKITCELCNGYKEIIKYQYFSTRYYPMYFTELIYNGKRDVKVLEECPKILIYEEEIFDRSKGKIFDSNKVKDIQSSVFGEPFNILMEKVSSQYNDSHNILKVPVKIKVSIEEIIIKEVQFKDKKKNNKIWIYGTGTDKDNIIIENKPLLWATEDIIGGVKNIISGKKI